MLILGMGLNDGVIHLTDVTTGEEITIKLLSTSRGQCRLGFEAGDNIQILRDKVYQRKDRTND